MIRLTYDPELVEEAVLLAEARRSPGDTAALRRERNKIYDVADPDRREVVFRSFHMDWFAILGFRVTIEALVRERPAVSTRLADGRILRAVARADETADLVDRIIPGAQAPQPILVVRIRPVSLLDQDALARLLRRELMHVDDMLDPRFGYERTLPPSELGPSYDTIVRNRYRVVWDVTVEGRLARLGLENAPARAARWQEFAETFRVLGGRCRAAFDDWFDCPSPTHRALLDFARATHQP